MSPVEPGEPSERPGDNWTGESDQPSPPRHHADTPSEPAMQPALRGDDSSPFLGGSDQPSYSQHVPDVYHEPAEPPRRSEQIGAADSNGSGATAAVAEPEHEPAEQTPVGPPKRGWWKRLIE